VGVALDAVPPPSVEVPSDDALSPVSPEDPDGVAVGVSSPEPEPFEPSGPPESWLP
jgi:hypothetical protein